jgi:hypothetical protein
MKDTLISFETAKLAKEKGFNWKVNNYFQLKTISGGVFEEYLEDSNQDINSDFPQNALFSRPSQSLLQKWLREKHNIEVYIIPWIYNNKTVYDFFVNYEGESRAYSTYELALETSLIEGLKHIK